MYSGTHIRYDQSVLGFCRLFRLGTYETVAFGTPEPLFRGEPLIQRWIMHDLSA